jgi:hypothetical protein
MGTTKPRKLEQDALQHCLTAVFGWEGGLPNKTLCNTDVFAALFQHYATVLDDAHAAGTLTNPDLIRLAEFLTEPSVQNLSAMVAGIPEHGRTFSQPRDRQAGSAKRAAIKSSLSSTSGISAEGEPCEHADRRGPSTKEIVEFLRKHQDRVVVIMLSRGGGFTHSRIAKEFGISRSRCYRYEKWFEGLADEYRQAIIGLGSAARAKHHGGKQAFEIASRLIASTEALAIVAVDMLLASDAEFSPAQLGYEPRGFSGGIPERESPAATPDSTPHGFLGGIRAKFSKWTGM